ncbi:NGG1p interacting factor 3 [Violaceomyces palustris]|uniref:NGG1p interacting factor 3 n=1 Tax=Violaceomyces palustris TaxID=1673888 RepID=A0ACD0NX35_9BASI|nr:NGG1p interacting factor 3 [Violaceomyces palustris]
MSSVLNLSKTVLKNPSLASAMKAMHKIAPLALADSSWDNVGLLLESPIQPKSNGIFLAIDLTTPVCEEILSKKGRISVAIVYHPIIFRGLKSMTLSDPQQASILRLASEGVSIYCPHTSLDATVGGINDWLARVVETDVYERLGDDQLEVDSEPILPTQVQGLEPSQKRAGMGRLIRLSQSIEFERLVQRVKRNLDLNFVQVSKASEKPIETVAVCAGSGGSVFKGVKADLLLTGELSHHEILAAKANGTSVILTNHTNTERKFLRDVLKPKLESILGQGTEVLVSVQDKDPLSVM